MEESWEVLTVSLSLCKSPFPHLLISAAGSPPPPAVAGELQGVVVPFPRQTCGRGVWRACVGVGWREALEQAAATADLLECCPPLLASAAGAIMRCLVAKAGVWLAAWLPRAEVCITTRREKGGAAVTTFFP